MRMDHGYKVVVQYVPVGVVLLIVEMAVVECVDVEVHLVVAAHPVVVDSQQGKLRENVVYRCHCHLGFALLADLFRYHVGAGMAEDYHCLVNGKPLWSCLE